MKKRLLITSIVMMLVVAVALSTATYAWFTSNANVTASSITMTAATNSAASIGISWTDGNYGTTIAATSPDAIKFAPVAIDDVQVGSSTLANTVWSSATIRDVASVKTFNTAYATTVTENEIGNNTDASSNNLTYTWANTTENSNTIYIHNGSTANSLSSVTAKATITGEAREFIRIAIYRYDGSNYILKGIMTNRYAFTAATGTAVEGTTYYNANGVAQEVSVGADVTSLFTRSDAVAGGDISTGTVATDAAVSTIDTTTNDATTSIALGGLAVDNGATGGDDVMLLKVIVWMDGTALNDDTAGSTGKVANIALDFDAAQ